jgi:tRNA nucleotidyltransferase/poly(A) polymerase
MPKIFKVGGCVRDAFLGINSKDIDFTFVLDNLDQTVESGFAEMEKWMTDQGFTIFLSVPEMFTIRAKFPIDHKFAKLDADFVMARKEISYMEGTRRPILELGTLEDDLMRRDFTLNAMAEDVDGNIIDLFNGQEDLEMKILRTPLDAKITMMDDPLRILRAIRFSITKGFLIHHTIFQAMEQEEILEKLRTTVSGERIREELFKMMKHDTVATIKLLTSIDQNQIPGLLDLIFANGLWLNPTFKHAK